MSRIHDMCAYISSLPLSENDLMNKFGKTKRTRRSQRARWHFHPCNPWNWSRQPQSRRWNECWKLTQVNLRRLLFWPSPDRHLGNTISSDSTTQNDGAAGIGWTDILLQGCNIRVDWLEPNTAIKWWWMCKIRGAARPEMATDGVRWSNLIWNCPGVHFTFSCSFRCSQHHDKKGLPQSLPQYLKQNLL